jgi:hypothetical protein
VSQTQAFDFSVSHRLLISVSQMGSSYFQGFGAASLRVANWDSILGANNQLPVF